MTELMNFITEKNISKINNIQTSNIYGPDMGNEHVIPEIINKFKSLKGKSLKIQGSGNEIRSFIYIDDFVQAFDLLLKRKNIYKYTI